MEQNEGRKQMASEQQMQDAATLIGRVEAEIGKAIIGQKEVIRQSVIAMLVGGNVLLEGVPGLGKTQLVKTMGQVMDLRFSRIQFTPDLMPADVIGTNIIVKDERGNSKFEFQPGPIFSNLVLADEINRATPKTQSALLEAMQEQTVTVSGVTYPMPQPYMVMATQNPIEMEGTYPLPEAQLDRFMCKLRVDFPNLEELREIMNITVGSGDDKLELEQIVDGPQILQIRRVIAAIPVARPVMDYAIRLVLATHCEDPCASEIAKRYIRYGASPRAVQSIMKGARARALLMGRYNVSFEDIRYMAYPTLRHRFFLNFDAISDGMNTDLLIAELLEAAKVEG